jgi:hypothetical protein
MTSVPIVRLTSLLSNNGHLRRLQEMPTLGAAGSREIVREQRMVKRSARKRRTGTAIMLSIAFLVLTGFGGGCVLVPRLPVALKSSARPQDRVALLPITPDDVSFVGVPTNLMVRVGNRVLNTLASAPDHSLVGPDAVRKAMRQTPALNENLECWLKPGGAPDAEKTQEFELLASRLGANRVVRSRLWYWENPVRLEGGEGLLAEIRGGEMRAEVELWDLSPVSLIAKQNGYGTYVQSSGLVFVFPYYGGTTFGRAVDLALREGLEKLFKSKSPRAQVP